MYLMYHLDDAGNRVYTLQVRVCAMYVCVLRLRSERLHGTHAFSPPEFAHAVCRPSFADVRTSLRSMNAKRTHW